MFWVEMVSVSAVPGLSGFVETWKEWPRAGVHPAPSFLSSSHKYLEGAAVRGSVLLGEQLVWCCLSHLSLYTSLCSHPWNLPGTVWSFTARTPWSHRATSLQHPRAEWVHFSEMGHFKMPWNSHQKSRRKVVNTLNYSPQTLSRHQCNFIDFSEISVNVGMEMQQI